MPFRLFIIYDGMIDDMPTIKDVARIACVSPATVSHVINGTKHISPETTEKVLRAIEEIKYSPNAAAKTLRSGRSHIIGVLVEDFRSINASEIIGGISEQLRMSDYHLFFTDLHLMDELVNHYERMDGCFDLIGEELTLLLKANVDGIIYLGMHERNLDNVLPEIDKPLVFVYAYDSKHSYVNMDTKTAAVNLTRHLIEQGHRRIACLAGHPKSEAMAVRLEGYRETMAEAGLEIPEGYIQYGDWEFGTGYENGEKFLALEKRPTAILSMNDYMAIGCMRALQEHGLSVPEDVSITGFDDKESTYYLRPSITSVNPQAKQMGIETAKLIIEQINNPNLSPRGVMMPCEIIYRDSVCPPKAD